MKFNKILKNFKEKNLFSPTRNDSNIEQKDISENQELNSESVTNAKDWVLERFEELENIRVYAENVPFEIIQYKHSGFLIKVKGLFGFVSINHMPWGYPNKDSWGSIEPTLLKKRFYGKIYFLESDRNTVIIDAKVPQFKKVELVEGQEYRGIVLYKLPYGVFVDIGYHFDWTCGSISGLLHVLHFENGVTIQDYSHGQEVLITFLGTNDKDKYVFSNNSSKIDWYLGNPNQLIGLRVWAKVVRSLEQNSVTALVLGNYAAYFTFFDSVYTRNQRKKAAKQILEFKNEQIILCKVVVCNDETQKLGIVWLGDDYMKFSNRNTIFEKLDEQTINDLIEKVILFKDIAQNDTIINLPD